MILVVSILAQVSSQAQGLRMNRAYAIVRVMVDDNGAPFAERYATGILPVGFFVRASIGVHATALAETDDFEFYHFPLTLMRSKDQVQPS